jgi:hypothetical protein
VVGRRSRNLRRPVSYGVGSFTNLVIIMNAPIVNRVLSAVVGATLGAATVALLIPTSLIAFFGWTILFLSIFGSVVIVGPEEWKTCVRWFRGRRLAE